MKICEPMPAVESQAPSSNPSENAPRRSGRPNVVSRLSKFARNEPSSTAPTANKGRGATPPRETGPRWRSVSAILPASRFDSGEDRHSGHQPFQQWLVLVELDPDGVRCTTLVKLPVALSGGNNANCEPVAGAIRSTRPRSFSFGKLSTVISTG